MTEGLSQGAPSEFFHKDGHMGATKNTGVAHPGGDAGNREGHTKRHYTNDKDCICGNK